VARRRAYAAKLAKKEKRTLAPVEIAGRLIAVSFWGKAWCENLESYSDFANRLPRGRTYVREGSLIDLQIQRGKVKAIVSGSAVYKVTIDIKTLAASHWARIKRDCSRRVDSLIDLLQGRFDQGVMARLTERDTGLFPRPGEIEMDCTCPDWARMCKHVAATLYGVGARLHADPELLFTLRDVDHLELVSQAVDAGNLDQALHVQSDNALNDSDLGEIFGIDVESQGVSRASSAAVPRSSRGLGSVQAGRAAVARPRRKNRGAAKRAQAKITESITTAIKHTTAAKRKKKAAKSG
jgi:uncharacterized Zn finger protein